MESNEEPEAIAPPPDALPPPPPEIPPNVVPVQLTTDTVPEETKKISKPKRSPITRRGVGSRGQKIQLVTNHFKVSISNTSGHFFHYSVSFFESVISLLWFFFPSLYNYVLIEIGFLVL